MYREIEISYHKEIKTGDLVSHLFKKTFFILMHIALLIFIIYSFHADYTKEKNYNIEYRSRIVRDGETLWSISSKFQPKHLSRWEYIYLISEKNGIEDLAIEAGDVIEIPVFKQ